MRILHIKRARDQRKKRVAAYCRVSTTLYEQEESLETQIRIYTEYISSRDCWVFAGIYSDEKSALKTGNRPGFQKLVQDALEGNVDLILVKSISRFSRNLVDCQNYIQCLLGGGVDVYFEKENIHTSDPSSGLIFSLMGAIAQDESRSIGENIRWTYRENFRRGHYNLGNNRMLGYASRQAVLTPNEDAWIVRLIFRLFLEGKTYRQIGAAVQKAGGRRLRSSRIFSGSALLRILQNETYVGDKFLQKQPPTDFLTKLPDKNQKYESWYLKDDHEAIVDRETFEAVQAVLAKRACDRQQGIYRKGREHFLYGRIFCGYCGAPYTRRTFYGHEKEKRICYKSWCCRERARGKAGNGCKNRIIREEKLLEMISENIVSRYEMDSDTGKMEPGTCKIWNCFTYVEIYGDEIRVPDIRREDRISP